MKKVIAAVRSEEEFSQALDAPVDIVFHLMPNIITLKKDADAAHAKGKKMFIHIDFAEGVGKDRYGILYTKAAGVDGIISTRVNIIRLAREAGVFTVQRFFIVDSRSVDTTVESLKSSKADMIEVMPGVVPKVIENLRSRVSVPIIAGGLIETEEEISSALAIGAAAVSTGRTELWK
ncbi:MAG: glycerol-3-phosphate responsive antiterminator [Clostridia bacterium]|nr:glycerol-3-phosphate responsive antiterminator [Clostridia bacterium]